MPCHLCGTRTQEVWYNNHGEGSSKSNNAYISSVLLPRSSVALARRGAPASPSSTGRNSGTTSMDSAFNSTRSTSCHCASCARLASERQRHVHYQIKSGAGLEVWQRLPRAGEQAQEVGEGALNARAQLQRTDQLQHSRQLPAKPALHGLEDLQRDAELVMMTAWHAYAPGKGRHCKERTPPGPPCQGAAP